jgi:predicted DsbA family dithiol-disulfide isomerase
VPRGPSGRPALHLLPTTASGQRPSSERRVPVEVEHSVKVEIWSDVVCPWCYIGKRRFERALAAFDGRDEVEVEWRSFQLNPEQPRGLADDHDAYLARKMGATPEQIRQMNDRLVALAAAEGLDYHFETYRVVNTIDAHRVLHLARAHGLGNAAHERLLRAQLVEGQLLEDPATLARLAGEIGLDEAEAAEAIATGAYADSVELDFEEAAALGIHAVPFFVLDRRYGIAGAQPSEVFLSALQQVRDEAAGAD